MHARLTRIQGSPDRLDEMGQQFEQVTLPQIQGLDGFQGYVLLGDRSNGTAIAITYWESGEAMQASEDAVQQPRQQAADTAGARSAPVVERYEVFQQR
jgi:heme-degrading monooxygenase HmoA